MTKETQLCLILEFITEYCSYMYLLKYLHFSHIMKIPVYAICEQQRHQSACTSTQSDHHFNSLLPRYYNTYSWYIQIFKTLASFSGWAGMFESYMVRKPRSQFFSWRGSYNLAPDKTGSVWIGFVSCIHLPLFLRAWHGVHKCHILLAGCSSSVMPVHLVCGWSQVRSSCSATFFRGDWSWNNISMAILSLLLIQEGQLSVTGERMCTKYC